MTETAPPAVTGVSTSEALEPGWDAGSRPPRALQISGSPSRASMVLNRTLDACQPIELKASVMARPFALWDAVLTSLVRSALTVGVLYASTLTPLVVVVTWLLLSRALA